MLSERRQRDQRRLTHAEQALSSIESILKKYHQEQNHIERDVEQQMRRVRTEAMIRKWINDPVLLLINIFGFLSLAGAVSLIIWLIIHSLLHLI